MGRTITIDLAEADYDRLERDARQQGVSVSEMVRQRLTEPPGRPDTGEEAVHRALVEAGLVREGARPSYAVEDWLAWHPVQVTGTPVSETIIEERR